MPRAVLKLPVVSSLSAPLPIAVLYLLVALCDVSADSPTAMLLVSASGSASILVPPIAMPPALMLIPNAPGPAIGDRQRHGRRTRHRRDVENSPPPVEGESNLTFNLGGTWKLNDQFNLLFSAGRSIHGDTDFMAYLGIQMLLGGAK